MKPLRNRLEEARDRTGIPWQTLERDYLLSWILAGISNIEALRQSLVFKGGTALKKCYFGDYRFSEDLDFSTIGHTPAGKAMEQAIIDSCKTAAKMLDEYAPVEIECERYAEKTPHPGGQEAFTVRARFPWHRKPQARIMIEITQDEKVLKSPVFRNILHDYEEPLHADVKVYPLEEILAEKLRAILQHAEKMADRGWSRSRARDYYDIWRILGKYESEMDLSGFTQFLHEKCAMRKVDFNSSDDFFSEQMISYVENTWEQWLGPLVPDLPDFHIVMAELRPEIDRITR